MQPFDGSEKSVESEQPLDKNESTQKTSMQVMMLENIRRIDLRETCDA